MAQRQRKEAWAEDRGGGGVKRETDAAQRRRSRDSIGMYTRAHTHTQTHTHTHIHTHTHTHAGSDEGELPVWEPEKTCSDEGLANADPNAEFSRQRYLRDIIKKAGGSSDHFRLVRKLMKHFEETHLDVEKFMRGGDLRGTGRPRRQDFKQALRNAVSFPPRIGLFSSYDRLLFLL